MKEMAQKINKIEANNVNIEKDIRILQEESKMFQASLISLACKTMDNCLRFRGIMEGKGENIFETMVENIAKYLGEQPEDVSFNLESVYRVNSGYATKHQLPRDVVVQVLSKK